MRDTGNHEYRDCKERSSCERCAVLACQKINCAMTFAGTFAFDKKPVRDNQMQFKRFANFQFSSFCVPVTSLLIRRRTSRHRCRRCRGWGQRLPLCGRPCCCWGGNWPAASPSLAAAPSSRRFGLFRPLPRSLWPATPARWRPVSLPAVCWRAAAFLLGRGSPGRDWRFCPLQPTPPPTAGKAPHESAQVETRRLGSTVSGCRNGAK